MQNTIVAVATPPGTGGIAVIRLSGKNAIETANAVFSGADLTLQASHTIKYGKIIDGDELIDTVTAAVFREPNSYTGENVVEISCHGGAIVARSILELCIRHGASPAEQGEFTRRAFLNGKLDLTQVEAVADIIHSVSVPGSKTAARQLSGEFTRRLSEMRQQLLDTSSLLELELDFSDEDLEFIERSKIKVKINETEIYCRNLADSYRSSEMLRAGYYVAITGFPNSGKSTLFNTLLQRHRAIVSEVPGTTRDYLEEIIHLGGIAVKLVDTAGLRDTEDMIEIEGIRIAESVLEQSDMLLVLNDISNSPTNSDTLFNSLKAKYQGSKVLLVQNKTDKADAGISNEYGDLFIAAKSGSGVDKLRAVIEKDAKESTDRVKDVLINQRHSTILRMAIAHLENAASAIDLGMENEIIAIDIREAVKVLGEITGDTWSEDVLNNIFSRFCIGK